MSRKTHHERILARVFRRAAESLAQGGDLAILGGCCRAIKAAERQITNPYERFYSTDYFASIYRGGRYNPTSFIEPGYWWASPVQAKDTERLLDPDKEARLLALLLAAEIAEGGGL